MTLIISNDEMKDIIEIAKPLEDSGLLLKKELVKEFKMKLKNKKRDLGIIRYARCKFIRKYFSRKRNK